MPNRISKPKTNPLISPATPIALQPHHLLSPPADLLANTATILTITPTQDTSPPSTAHPKAPASASASAFTIHRIRAHETPDSPNRAVLLYTVYGKPWPNMTRTICDAEDVPVLVLRRAWLPIRKWMARLPDQQADLMVASTPWVTDGPGSRIGVGGGFRLDVRFVNALASAVRERRVGRGSGSGSGLAVSDDEPPPYSAVSPIRGEEGVGDAGNEKDIRPHPHSRQDPVQAPVAPTLLPSYASVRRNSPNSLRDLLDAIEPPQEPAPASPFLSSASTSASRNANASPGSSRTSPRPEANASPGAKVELKVKQLAGSGTGVMMGNQKIMHISRHNTMDYSRSKVKLRPRWEVEVSEGVDLLLAVNIVLIMAETVSSQNRWK